MTVEYFPSLAPTLQVQLVPSNMDLPRLKRNSVGELNMNTSRIRDVVSYLRMKLQRTGRNSTLTVIK